MGGVLRAGLAVVTDSPRAQFKPTEVLSFGMQDIDHFRGTCGGSHVNSVARHNGETTRRNVLCTLLLGDITYTPGPTTAFAPSP